jgi:hypothetical protein
MVIRTGWGHENPRASTVVLILITPLFFDGINRIDVIFLSC